MSDGHMMMDCRNEVMWDQSSLRSGFKSRATLVMLGREGHCCGKLVSVSRCAFVFGLDTETDPDVRLIAASGASKDTVVVTPLMEYVRLRRAAKSTPQV